MNLPSYGSTFQHFLQGFQSLCPPGRDVGGSSGQAHLIRGLDRSIVAWEINFLSVISSLGSQRDLSSSSLLFFLFPCSQINNEFVHSKQARKRLIRHEFNDGRHFRVFIQ